MTKATIVISITLPSLHATGTVGSSYLGDIALDDIEMTNNGVCEETTTCDFETDDCGWENVQRTDQSDWLRNHGHTSTRYVQAKGYGQGHR